MGFLHGAADIIRQCLASGRDFWFLDHAYFSRGYENGNFRAVKNGIHKTAISGEARFHVSCSPWRQGGAKTVVIPPSETIAYTFDAKDWTAKTLEDVTAHGLDPVIKRKEDGPLADALRNAGAVVSFASVAEVEAARAGVQVFVSKHSPCWPIRGKDYNKMHAPDRKTWLGSLTCAQFHISEFASGFAWRTLNGTHNLCQSKV